LSEISKKWVCAIVVQTFFCIFASHITFLNKHDFRQQNGMNKKTKKNRITHAVSAASHQYLEYICSMAKKS
jgi:hypothetical protein